MLKLEYKDLNEAYLGVNRLILEDPDKHLDYMENTRGVLEDLFITVKSTNCDQIDLGALGYKANKWGHLIRTYMDLKKFKVFQELCKTSKGVSIGFDFNRKETGNGSCMRELILTRTTRGKVWTGARIIWRATELQKRWAADLILVHRMLEAIPNSDFKEITIYVVSAYQSAMYVIPLVEPIFGVKMENLDPEKNKYWKTIRYREQKYYQFDSPVQKLSPARIMQEVHYANLKGEKHIPVTFKDCILGV